MDSRTGDYFPIEVVGDETKKMFLVYEKNNNHNSPKWQSIKTCLGYRTRIAKDDRRLFETREAAIKSKIAELDDLKTQHELQVEMLKMKLRQVKGLL